MDGQLGVDGSSGEVKRGAVTGAWNSPVRFPRLRLQRIHAKVWRLYFFC